MNRTRLRVTRLSVRLGTSTVLDDVDLEVFEGELLALVGPNGAGKTTLLHVLAGDLRPTRGEVELDGKPLGRYRPNELARLRSVLTQANDVTFAFTTAEVVAMGRSPWRESSTATDDEAAVRRAMADAEVEQLADRRIPELSGGERARVAYGRLRAQDCAIVLLDEPTASLDIRHQERLLQQTRRHAHAGGSAVVVLHDLNLASAYADRIAVLGDGRLRAIDQPASALSSALLSEVYGHPIEVRPTASGGPMVLPVREPLSIAAQREETVGV